MKADLLNISSIENFFYSVLHKKVSDKVFLGGLPSTIQSTWTDMVVVDISSTIKDLTAFGLGTVSILLYPNKNRADGSKNSPVTSALGKKLNLALESYKKDNYSIRRVGTFSEYDSVRKIYYDVVLVQIMIV